METTIKIIGVNGETATIAGERAGDKGVYLASELSGFMDPEVVVQSESPANYPGGRYVSHRTQVRRVLFAVEILNDGPGFRSWRSRDSEWRKMWAYDKPTQIQVSTPDGTRTLNAHLESVEVVTDIDPNIQPINRTIMTVVAYDPFWWGIERTYEAEVANGFATVSVPEANPTDQDVWPIWVVEADGQWTLPDYSFKNDDLADRRVELPVLAVGEHTVVNTNPMARQLTSVTNSPVWQRMNGKRFRHPIPPYTGEVDFLVSRNGSSTSRKVQLRLQRPFSRPWGML